MKTRVEIGSKRKENCEWCDIVDTVKNFGRLRKSKLHSSHFGA